MGKRRIIGNSLHKSLQIQLQNCSLGGLSLQLNIFSVFFLWYLLFSRYDVVFKVTFKSLLIAYFLPFLSRSIMSTYLILSFQVSVETTSERDLKIK